KAKRHRQVAEGLSLGAQIDLGRPLAGVAIDIGLRIEEIGAEWTAVHEQMNDALGRRRKVRADRRGGGLGGEQVGKSERADAAAESLDHFTASKSRGHHVVHPTLCY